jgi:hypothetical protein
MALSSLIPNEMRSTLRRALQGEVTIRLHSQDRLLTPPRLFRATLNTCRDSSAIVIVHEQE